MPRDVEELCESQQRGAHVERYTRLAIEGDVSRPDGRSDDRESGDDQRSAAFERSVDLIAKLEQGRKQSARVTSLIKLADALDVDLSELVGKRPRLNTDDDARVMAAQSARSRSRTPISATLWDRFGSAFRG